MFREIFVRHPKGSNTSDDGNPAKNRSLIRLHGVSVLEFEALLTFFYERYVDCTFAG